MLGKSNPTMMGINQMIGMVKAAQNPQAAVSQLAQSNPQMQQVMNVVNQNGGNAKQAFYNLCQQRGVDPNSILSQLQN